MNTHDNGQESTRGPRWTEQERKHYASQIADARNARGWSQQELSEAADVARKTVGNIERGATVPQEDVLLRIMVALDMYGDRFEALSAGTRAYLGTIAGMIEKMPDPPLSTVMIGVQATLAAALREAHRPTAPVTDINSKRPAVEPLPDMNEHAARKRKAPRKPRANDAGEESQDTGGVGPA